MATIHEVRESALNLYNPATKDAETLLAEFIDRKKLLERILDIIRHNVADKPQQHVIVVGPRGMGKTTLLCAIRYSILKDDALNRQWLPLQFDEEQYGIGDLADFWLEALRHLEIECKPATSQVDQLLNTASDELAQHAQDAFFELLAQSGKRALLLVDNVNDMFAAIDDGIALNKLRALWMTDARMTVIGATPSYFDEVTAVDQAFHDFFRTFHIDRLTQPELEAFLRHFAQMRGDTQVIQAIEQAPQRIAAMRILTGGNPRLVMFGYRVLREGLDGDVRRDLERLLDECTPFFKHRIESLAKEARRTFDAIARRWDPVTVDDIRVELRKPSNYISAQIKRLIDEGLIESISGEKKKRYQVSERFYNVFYLMRYSREGRRRLRWLVNFMQVFYTRQDYRHWARHLAYELNNSIDESQRNHKLDFLYAISMAADSHGRSAAFETMVRDAINHSDRSSLSAEITYNDPVKQYGHYYFAAEVLWLLKPETRKLLGFKPGHGGWWKILRKQINQDNLTEKVEAHLTKLEHWHTKTTYHACAVGVILDWLFGKSEQAEKLLRKAIELDPRNAIAWNYQGIELASRGRHKESEEAYRQALAHDSELASAWSNLGATLSRQGRHREAKEVYYKAFELDPEYSLTLINIAGKSLLNFRDVEDAITLLLEGLSLDPQHLYGRLALNYFWLRALPIASSKIINSENQADIHHLPKVMIETLLAQAADGKQQAVLDALLALDEAAQQPFEVLILALQALQDRSVLQHIAREKRDVVLDVMASIAPEDG